METVHHSASFRQNFFNQAAAPTAAEPSYAPAAPSPGSPRPVWGAGPGVAVPSPKYHRAPHHGPPAAGEQGEHAANEGGMRHRQLQAYAGAHAEIVNAQQQQQRAAATVQAAK
jgi:hypothetical protein